MAKPPKTTFVCQNCSAVYARWQGQCDQCGSWNTLAEQVVSSEPLSAKNASRSQIKNLDSKQFLLSFEQQNSQVQNWQRTSTCLAEFDRVLGEDKTGVGLVPGSVVLIGGEPGIGKSTLLSQMVIEMSKKSDQSTPVGSLWYVCGEESPQQIGQRLQRMFKTKENTKQDFLARLRFVTTTDVDYLSALVETEKPQLLIVDSIQTLSTADLLSPAGSLGQIKACADRLTAVAKRHHIPIFLVGHVNKDGAIAGPKILEHIVDAILELSGERGGDLRFLRAVKNRFGATDEVGVFQLVENGLAEISNPSALFLEQTIDSAPGSVVTCLMEGTRPILTEVQALVVPSQLAMPRRVGRGIDLSRIQILSAVLQKQVGLPLASNDVFLSVVGGLQVREPAIDLALAVAIASSYFEKPVPKKSLFLGEVGLMGEIRNVSNFARRVKEAKRLGYNQIYSRETHRSLRDLIKTLWPNARRRSQQSNYRFSSDQKPSPDSDFS